MIHLHLDDGPHEGRVLLYGIWWPKEDAAYAKELGASALSTAEIVRLWAENRPSLRKTQTVTQAPETVTQGPPVTAPVTPDRNANAERQRRYRERKRTGGDGG